VFFVGAAVLFLLKPFRLTCYTGFQLSFGGRLLTIGIEAVSNCICVSEQLKLRVYRLFGFCFVEKCFYRWCSLDIPYRIL
jgi:hypothetical protein